MHYIYFPQKYTLNHKEDQENLFVDVKKNLFKFYEKSDRHAVPV